MRARLTILLILLPLGLWLAYGLAGERVASRISARYGERIVAKGDGKFNDARAFVKIVLKDIAFLTTAGCLLLLLYSWTAAALARRLSLPARWVAQGWSAFICLNLFAAAAAQTVLFWCVLYTGKDNIQNYTQWRIKQALMSDCAVPGQIVLLGSSQTRAQIDAKVLNARFGSKMWTTELHFPGSSIYDTRLSLEHLPNVRIDYVVIYICEGNFYVNFANDRLMYFFGLRDLPEFWNLGAGSPKFDRYVVSGLLADIFPLYRIWQPLMARVRVWETQNVAQQKYDATLDNDLAERAKRTADNLHMNAISEFQKRSFATFAQACRQRGARLIVCCGQFNPILARDVDPAVRLDMVSFLRQQASQDTNIVLLLNEQMPPQSEQDYEDLSHVNKEARARFSVYLADRLEEALAHPAPAAK